VTLALLKEHNLAKKLHQPVKLLGNGTLDRPLTVRVHAVSQTAKEKVEAAGGTIELLATKS
jgi:large subunit ribosomal protein L15